MVSTFVGGVDGFLDGVGTEAQFHTPNSVVVTSVGDVFVADTGNNNIRQITSTGWLSQRILNFVFVFLWLNYERN